MCPWTLFTPNPMAEVFFKDLNIWVCICGYLKVIPLCNMQLYGMNTLKLSNTTSITTKWKPNPHDSTSSGSWCCGQPLRSVGFLFFLLLVQKSQITHTYKYTRIHKLVVPLGVLCFGSICSPTYILSTCVCLFAVCLLSPRAPHRAPAWPL